MNRTLNRTENRTEARQQLAETWLFKEHNGSILLRDIALIEAVETFENETLSNTLYQVETPSSTWSTAQLGS